MRFVVVFRTTLHLVPALHVSQPLQDPSAKSRLSQIGSALTLLAKRVCVRVCVSVCVCARVRVRVCARRVKSEKEHVRVHCSNLVLSETMFSKHFVHAFGTP